jgi:hypothetical protein
MGFIVTKPFEVFNDLKGNPLENGKLFIGVTNLNPKTNPVSVFFDEALTIPADQPIRTIGGYPSQNGTPANIYIANINYSITVDDKNDKFIYSRLDSDNIPDEVLARDTISDLTAIPKASLADNQQTLVSGYTTIGDTGGDPFFWNSASTATEDLIVTFESDEGGTGRWIRILEDRITFAMGGAVGSGSDETTEMQRAMDYIEANGGLLTADGSKQYITSLSLLIENASDFIIDFNGAEIFTANSTAVTFNQGIIRTNTCTGYTIRNLTGDGNRANRTPAEVSSHACALFGCSNFRYENIDMVNSVVDGFILTTLDNTDATKSCSDGVFVNCSADNSFRNGLSDINSIDVDFYHCKFKNSNGVDPEAGVDIESDAGSVTPANSRLRFFGLSTDGNNGFGFKNTTKTGNREVYLYSPHFKSDLGGAMSIGAATYVYGGLCEEYSSITHSDNLFEGIIEFNSSTAETRGIIDGMQFKNITAASSKCVFGTGSTGPISVLNCTADNVLSFVDIRAEDGQIHKNYIDGSTSAILFQGDGTHCSENTVVADLGVAIQVAGGNYHTVTNNTVKSAVGRAMVVNGIGSTFTGNKFFGVSTPTDAWIRDFGSLNYYSDNYFEAVSSEPTILAIKFSGVPAVVAWNRVTNLHTTDAYDFVGGFVTAFFGYNTGGSANDINVKRS